MKRVYTLSVLMLLSACVVSAKPIPAASAAPVVPGQWHSNLAAAKAKAQLEKIPLLVLWGDPDCGYCTDFDESLDLPECQAYLAERGLILVYEKTAAKPATAAKSWAGYGEWPCIRVTWWQGGQLLSDVDYPDPRAAADHRWTRPNAKQATTTAQALVNFEKFKAVIESKVGTYSAVPPDTSKDKYDPDNDAAAGAPLLVWKDQVQSEALKLAKRNDDIVYTDTNDWFQLAVEAGKTYLVSVTNVSGVSVDAPMIAIYKDAGGTQEFGAPMTLAQGAFEFVPAAGGTAFVKVWRPSVTDANIQYTLKYMRRAAGQVEFAAASVSAAETAKSVVLTLRRVGGTSGPAKVTLGYNDSLNSSQSATAGQDFTGPAGVLTWADGDAANKTLTVTLLKTVAQWEGDETFEVKLLADAAVSPQLTVGAPAKVTLKEVDPFTTVTRNPTPASGSVLLARDLGEFSWDDVIGVESDLAGKRFYNIYAGSSATVMQLLAQNLTEAEFDMAGNAAFQALVALANSKPVYWRVDAVYTGGVVPSVTKGPAWAVSVLPEGSPEFTDASDVQANLLVGVQANVGPLAFTNGLGGTPLVGLAVNGGSLPTGLRLEIRNGNQVWLTGLPTRVASGSLLVQVKNQSGAVTNPGTTVRLNYQVAALPTFMVGTYQGWVGELEATGIIGRVTLSVTSAGRVSGKAYFPLGAPGYAGTYSFLATSYQAVSNGTAWITGNLTRTGAASVPAWFSISLADGRVQGGLGAPDAQTPVTLFRNNWGVAGMPALAAQYAGYYTAAFPVLGLAPESAPKGSGYATFTLDTRGGFKVAGRLADGSLLTLSGVLFEVLEGEGAPYVCAFLYSAPTAYMGGLFAGVVCFGDLNGNGVKDVGLLEGAPLRWMSRSPFALPVYDKVQPGFEAVLDAVGGKYNKLENLKAFYAGKSLFVGDLDETPELGYKLSVRALNGSGVAVTTTTQESAAPLSWQSAVNLAVTPKTDGSGFTLAATDLVKLGTAPDGQPLYNYATAVNPNGVKMVFNRATGVMTGSFYAYYDYATLSDVTKAVETKTWAHTAKLCSYACVLLPEQIDAGSAVEAAGYGLFGSSSTYEITPGVIRTYAFNYSFGFTLMSALLDR